MPKFPLKLFTLIAIVFGAILGLPEAALADPLSALIFAPAVAAGAAGPAVAAGIAGSIHAAIGTAISVISTVGQVFGQVQSARSNAAFAEQEALNIEAQARFNAQLAEREAIEIEQRAEFNALQASRDAILAEQEAKINADLRRTEAAQIAGEAIAEERVSAKKHKAIIARQRAITGGRGIDVGSGSPLAVLINSIEEAELESLSILGTGRAGEGAKLLQADLEAFRGTIAAGRLRSEADLIRFEGRTGAFRARRSGELELFRGRTGAGLARRRASIARAGIGGTIITGARQLGGVLLRA